MRVEDEAAAQARVKYVRGGVKKKRGGVVDFTSP